jgi:hypothetical protein
MTPLKPNEVEYRRRGEKGSVRLQCPRDYDLFAPLFNDGFPIAEARKIVKERRRSEEIARRAEHNGIPAEMQETLDREFGD